MAVYIVHWTLEIGHWGEWGDWGDLGRVAESVVTLLRRNEPSKDLVSQSFSSKLTCEREMAQKALELLLTAQNAFVSMF